MNKMEIRTNKLRNLVAADGGPAEFARKRSLRNADKPIDPTYVSQILNGHRSFGEKAAENMISRAGLPVGFFDVPEQDLLTADHIRPYAESISPKLQALIDQLLAQQDNTDLIELVEHVLRVVGKASPQKRQPTRQNREKSHKRTLVPNVTLEGDDQHVSPPISTKQHKKHG